MMGDRCPAIPTRIVRFASKFLTNNVFPHGYRSFNRVFFSFISRTPMEGPRLLSCLHSFCLPCLESLMVGESKRDAVISCPICQQTTTVSLFLSYLFVSLFLNIYNYEYKSIKQ